MELFALLLVGCVAQASSSQTPGEYAASGSDHHDCCSCFSHLLHCNNTSTAALMDACALVPLVGRRDSFIQELTQAIFKHETRPRHCKDLQDAGDNVNGLRHIYPYPGQPERHLTVYCDQATDGGGWTVFQRRTDSPVREDFYRTWVEYLLGFGNLEGEFWLGLEPIHALTSTSLQELRIDFADYDGGQRYAKYGVFYITDAATKYTLRIGRYSGDAGDSLGTYHLGIKFSTHDADHDEHVLNCAQLYRGGWWYNGCHHSNLNGYQDVGGNTELYVGINWVTWRGHKYSLRRTAMMVRPAF